MRRPPRRARGAREDHAQHVGALVVGDERAEAKQVVARLRREPRAHVRRRAGRPSPPRARSARARRAARARARTGCAHRVLTPISRQLNAAMSTPTESSPRLERLHERRPGAGERIEHAAARRHVPAEELLDELRDVLAEIRMQPVDVLRPLALGQVALGPGEVEVEPGVELLLRRHMPGFDVGLERVLHDLQPARALGDHVEADVELAERRIRGEPAPRRRDAAARSSPASPSRAGRRSRRRAFDFTSKKTSARPRRTTRSSS